MDRINCLECGVTFCSRFNMMRHKRNKHLNEDEHFRISTHMPNFATGAHLGAPLQGAPQGAPGAHLGTPLGAHLGAPLQGAPQGAPGAHLGAPRAPLQGAPQGAPEDVSQGASRGAPQGALQGGPQEIKPTILQHPFTMMISGPTACGKTTFVKELLQNHIYRIKPGVQRIVWLYKRWQPMYGEIQSTVYPEVPRHSIRHKRRRIF
ncbi:uncharacterized protein LOC128559300 [Mercenaria mercenaria]|uniref:uncharacterized protein LOC128559300 n=1 Tax=Mercenaria mercenaria TaxID=6596 RepID=UPI00234E7B3A|nr:uncharacterized protein LOC128559300 [Mercenaria mercenaria]